MDGKQDCIIILQFGFFSFLWNKYCVDKKERTNENIYPKKDTYIYIGKDTNKMHENVK